MDKRRYGGMDGFGGYWVHCNIVQIVAPNRKSVH